MYDFILQRLSVLEINFISIYRYSLHLNCWHNLLFISLYNILVFFTFWSYRQWEGIASTLIIIGPYVTCTMRNCTTRNASGSQRDIQCISLLCKEHIHQGSYKLKERNQEIDWRSKHLCLFSSKNLTINVLNIGWNVYTLNKNYNTTQYVVYPRDLVYDGL